jgi:hypothetical protein
MNAPPRARNPFRFHTRLHLSELTGIKAATLAQFLEHLRSVPGSCIYYHTHRYLQQHQYLSPEPPNDFAHWVTYELGDEELGERLASIDTVRFPTIRRLRNRIVGVIEEHIERNPTAKRRFADEGEEFHFIKSVSFVIPTKHVAWDLGEFAGVLKKITVDSIYYHMFEARLRLERGQNDFSLWLDTSLGEKRIAEEISRLDPYTRTLDNLRTTIIGIVEHGTGC